MSKDKFLSAVENTFGFCGVVYGWDSECNWWMGGSAIR